MNPLWMLVPVPLIACGSALLAPVTRIPSLCAAAMLVQVFVAFFTCAIMPPTDGVATFFVLVTTCVTAASLLHASFYFEAERAVGHAPGPRTMRGVYFFAPLFVLSMYGVVVADDLGLLWVAMEASTLLSAPLVYYRGTRTSLEATWKYLMMCSVGIAFAFFGTATLYAASQTVAGLGEGTLSLQALLAHASQLPGDRMRLAFVFLLLGYGTKAGLFPLHSWLPDAHSEAPAPFSALLSGALLNCALVALWRVAGLAAAAGQLAFVQATLLPMALATVGVASLFLIRQHDIKRLLAYSSMENVGIMAVAIALGAGGAFGAQALNHSLAKVALFLLAGNLMQATGTKKIRGLRGVFEHRPAQGLLLLLAALAAVGTPPFGSFIAEWGVLAAAVSAHHYTAMGVVVASLAVAFVAISMHVTSMVFGGAPRDWKTAGDPRGTRGWLVPAMLVAAALALGLLAAPGLLMLAGGL